MKRKPIPLSQIVNLLDNFFQIKQLAQDPAMSHFVPMVYKQAQINWEKIFEPDFQKRFNGLMIRGADNVEKIFTASFPHKEVIQKFLSRSKSGDLLFVHHPIPLECGDPKGNLGKGFLPIKSNLIQKIIRKNLSVYSCHAPLDYHKKISTNRAIAKALQATIESEFLQYGNGYAGLIVTVRPISTMSLIKKLKMIFDIPYVDFVGKNLKKITKVGIVAGGGDEVEYMQTVCEKGAQAYITGEIFSHYDNEWGRQNTLKIQKYSEAVGMSMIGVSHGASEYLVMKTQIPEWLRKKFTISIIPISQSVWWM